jgi:uncharacterized protein involved in response to NO
VKPVPISIAAKADPLAPPSPPAGLPLLRLGFRPFYLGAALFATLAVPLWVAVFLGHAQLELGVAPMLWHAHEMLFGFAIAVIVGFLLTAGQAWTGLPTPRGAALGTLAALWLLARVTAVVAPYPVYALIDVLLLPAVAAIFGSVLLRSRNMRNLPLAGILALLALANLCFHLAALGTVRLSPLQPLHAALGLIVLIECVIAGRVIPNFTANATPGLRITPHPRLGMGSLAVTGLALAAWVFAPASPVSGVALVAAGLLQWLRQSHWGAGATLRRPILWILHVSYAWIGFGLVLLGLAAFGVVSGSAGLHALAVGATGGLILGMITRTARGHTGRPLRTGRAETLAYALVLGAAVARVVLPLVAPQALAAWLGLAAAGWSAAFAIYLWVYTPWLLRARMDGKDG